MTDKTGEGKALVERCRKLGWHIEEMKDGAWRITCPDNYRVQVHTSPSDVNATRALLHKLNKHGFAQAEREAKTRAERERQARIDEDRQRNEAATVAARLRAEREALALARAAGPYHSEQPDLGELLKAHPAPRTYQRVVITPEMAKEMLTRNTHNRPIRNADAVALSEEIKKGAWAYTHQGVAFDTNAVLLDGQTRLTAIQWSGHPVEMMVSVGMPPDSFPVIDAGRRRTAGQALAIGEVRHAAAMAGAMRLLWLYTTYGAELAQHINERVSTQSIVDTLNRCNRTDLDDVVVHAMTLRRETRAPVSPAIMAFYLILQANAGRREQAMHYLTEVGTGDGARNAPATLVHRQLNKVRFDGRMAGPEVAARIIAGWNHTVSGAKIQRILIRWENGFPHPAVPA